MQVASFSQHDDDLLIDVVAPVAALRVREKDSHKVFDISCAIDGSRITIPLAALQSALPASPSRYDLIALPIDGLEETTLDVEGHLEVPLWLRYFRPCEQGAPTVPHVYLNRAGYFSIVVRNPVYVDHDERRFRYRHALTALVAKRRAITVDFELTAVEAGQFEIVGCDLRFHSNDEFIRIVAADVEQRWTGNSVVGRMRIIVPSNIDLVPLRYAMYATLRDRFSGSLAHLRLDHASREFYERMHSMIQPPRVRISGDRVLTLATSPTSTLVSFIVRNSSRYDRATVQQLVFSTIARAEALVRRVTRRPRKPTALIFEKEASTAQDNGLALFEYLLNGATPVEFDFRYLMDRDSLQWDRVSGLSRVTPKFSLEHWRLVTSPTTFLLSSDVRYHLANLFAQPGLLDKHAFARKNYFLQHGVTGLTRVAIFNPKSAIFPDFSAATSEWEKEILVERGMAPEHVDVTGFARWDKLTRSRGDRVRRILYMPSWRDWLEGRSARELLQSDYLASISSLLDSPELHDMLARHDIEFQFMPHPKFKELSTALRASNPRISLLCQDEIDFTEVIDRSDLVITDYSSVFWDFLQSYKTVLLYQFDLARYQAKLGDFRSEGFHRVMNRLSVSFTEDQLLDQLSAVLSSDPLAVLAHNERLARAAFPHHDHDNSQRIVARVGERLGELCMPREMPEYEQADIGYREHLTSDFKIRPE